MAFNDMVLNVQELVQTIKALGSHGVLHLALLQNREKYGRPCIVIAESFPLAKLEVNISDVTSYDHEDLISFYALRVGYRYVGIDVKISAPKEGKCAVFITAEFEEVVPAQIVQEYIIIESISE